jgi:hypothetical protein
MHTDALKAHTLLRTLPHTFNALYALQKKKPDMLGDLLNAQAEADGGKIPNVFLSITSALLAQICELDSVAITINGPKYYIARVGLIVLPEDHRIAPQHRYV